MQNERTRRKNLKKKRFSSIKFPSWWESSLLGTRKVNFCLVSFLFFGFFLVSLWCFSFVEENNICKHRVEDDDSWLRRASPKKEPKNERFVWCPVVYETTRFYAAQYQSPRRIARRRIRIIRGDERERFCTSSSSDNFLSSRKGNSRRVRLLSVRLKEIFFR